MITDQLFIYKDFDNDRILKDFDILTGKIGQEDFDKEFMREAAIDLVNGLVEFSADKGFEGNLFHAYLTYLLVNNENAYSRLCEIRGQVTGTINDVVINDFTLFKQMFDFNTANVIKATDVKALEAVESYKRADTGKSVFNKRIRDRIAELCNRLESSSTAEEFKDYVTEFYKEYGVGNFGLHKAFRIKEGTNGEEAVIEPMKNILHVSFDDLVGYDTAKKKLIDNTECFLKGMPANNCLLFGDAGTGKSSSIKALLNKYYPDGLRMIEIYKHQFKELPSIVDQIKNRNYKFIIYMDDLSFESFEIEYKYLKAIIEGGLEKKPDNVLIYATSNRRHLVRENFSDRDEGDDKHASETVAEKLSLVSRFGEQIYFPSPSKKEFDNIVKALAARKDINMSEEELLLEANKWELAHSGLSGRTAKQFVDYISYNPCGRENPRF